MLRKVGTQVVKWTTEGAVKEDTQKSKTSSILRREGIRQLPGICWYPVRAQAIVKQGGTAGNVYDPSLTEEDSVMGGFFVPFQSHEILTYIRRMLAFVRIYENISLAR